MKWEKDEMEDVTRTRYEYCFAGFAEKQQTSGIQAFREVVVLLRLGHP